MGARGGALVPAVEVQWRAEVPRLGLRKNVLGEVAGGPARLCIASRRAQPLWGRRAGAKSLGGTQGRVHVETLRAVESIGFGQAEVQKCGHDVG